MKTRFLFHSSSNSFCLIASHMSTKYIRILGSFTLNDYFHFIFAKITLYQQNLDNCLPIYNYIQIKCRRKILVHQCSWKNQSKWILEVHFIYTWLDPELVWFLINTADKILLIQTACVCKLYWSTSLNSSSYKPDHSVVFAWKIYAAWRDCYLIDFILTNVWWRKTSINQYIR